MKTKKLLTMVVSIILMLIMSISIVGCKDGTPTQETSLFDYSKTLNSWYLSKMENVDAFEEKSLNLTFSSTASETEELEYYEKLGDTENALTYINESLVVPDIKEGEYAISNIWTEI